MTRKKDRTDRRPPRKAVRVYDIQCSLEEETVVRASCCMCGEPVYEEGLTAEQVALQLFDEGWRDETSDKYAMSGLMCPDCVATPDAKRGD